jgi:methyltransferase (TIGR00027 family)
MDEFRPSRTMQLAAMLRAVHLLWDDPPKVLEDTLALRLCGFENEAALGLAHEAATKLFAERAGLDFAQSAARYGRSHAVMSGRYVEDELEQAIKRGLSQYVILGAGLDSFAYRRSDLTNALHVFEVDHPASQASKQARLKDLHVELPPHLTFVPVDFEKQTLLEGLRKAGYRPQVPALFSWLAVTTYLTENAIFDTLRAISSLAMDTQIIFDYWIPVELLNEEDRPLHEAGLALAAASGEPWLSFFEPASLARQIRKLGFSEVWDFGPQEGNASYFAGRSDGVRLNSMLHLIRARVG